MPWSITMLLHNDAAMGAAECYGTTIERDAAA